MGATRVQRPVPETYLPRRFGRIEQNLRPAYQSPNCSAVFACITMSVGCFARRKSSAREIRRRASVTETRIYVGRKARGNVQVKVHTVSCNDDPLRCSDNPRDMSRRCERTSVKRHRFRRGDYLVNIVSGRVGCCGLAKRLCERRAGRASSRAPRGAPRFRRKSRFLSLPLCGACPIVGYCGFLNKLLTQKKKEREETPRIAPRTPHTPLSECSSQRYTPHTRCACIYVSGTHQHMDSHMHMSCTCACACACIHIPRLLYAHVWHAANHAQCMC